MFRVAFRPKVSIVFMLVALLASVTLLLQPSQASATASVGNRVSVWLTTANLQEHITQQKDVSFSTGSGSGVIKITVDENKTYQQMDGFGASITDGSAWLIYNKMTLLGNFLSCKVKPLESRDACGSQFIPIE